ncbi:hypothetical protein L345_09397, partial [Ophiophagus hannah]
GLSWVDYSQPGEDGAPRASCQRDPYDSVSSDGEWRRGSGWAGWVDTLPNAPGTPLGARPLGARWRGRLLGRRGCAWREALGQRWKRLQSRLGTPGDKRSLNIRRVLEVAQLQRKAGRRLVEFRMRGAKKRNGEWIAGNISFPAFMTQEEAGFTHCTKPGGGRGQLDVTHVGVLVVARALC